MFTFQTSVSGTVFIDVNGNGARESNVEAGVIGVNVTLRAAQPSSSVVIASATTDVFGKYVLSGQFDLGSYIVSYFVPSGVGFLIRRSVSIMITKGGDVSNVDVGVSGSGTIQTYDGTSNNFEHAKWGSNGVAQLRKAPAMYGDGVSTPGGGSRKSAREISNIMCASPTDGVTNVASMTAMVYAWGQVHNYNHRHNATIIITVPYHYPTDTITTLCYVIVKSHDDAA